MILSMKDWGIIMDIMVVINQMIFNYWTWLFYAKKENIK